MQNNLTAAIIIPARYGSTRFPGKVLKMLNGKTVLEWCYQAAVRSQAGPVLIATDDPRIQKAAAQFNAPSVLTSSLCPSGTDRVYEAAKSRPEDVIINLQGDELFVEPDTVQKILSALRRDPEAAIATAAAPLLDAGKINSPHTVKVVLSAQGRALYFSRSPIPHASKTTPGPVYLEHIGIYAFRKTSLEQFVRLPVGRLEALEGLEQLRALENGLPIQVVTVGSAPVNINVPEDLEHAARRLKEQHA
ncbi:MAG: hypothetical protein A3G41_03470 [Elusimicrobia bacterium RIFCSPLOWO2_12_FULL_59_9]|nr:MAG: hypothetical protein A3G41_03470 [Elusimicrobia bacterium RIFCSPLOWO2_12_FULL_59_9]